MGYRELSELGGLANWTTVGFERIGRITELSESDSVLELPEWSSRRSKLEGRGKRMEDSIDIQAAVE